MYDMTSRHDNDPTTQQPADAEMSDTWKSAEVDFRISRVIGSLGLVAFLGLFWNTSHADYAKRGYEYPASNPTNLAMHYDGMIFPDTSLDIDPEDTHSCPIEQGSSVIEAANDCLSIPLEVRESNGFRVSTQATADKGVVHEGDEVIVVGVEKEGEETVYVVAGVLAGGSPTK